MKKYKLIKWYPGLPEEWKNQEIYIQKRQYKNGPKVGYTNQHYLYEFSPEIIECNPNYWEEIKPVLITTGDNVEIFKGQEYFTVVNDKNDNEITFSTEQAADDYIKKNTVLFTTEDGVDIKLDDKYCHITDSGNISPEQFAHKDSGKLDNIKYFSTKEKAQEYIDNNKIYFTTEDGNNLKLNDTFYYVDVITGKLFADEITKYSTPKDYENCKIFYFKQNAEIYFFENITCLSYNDVKKYLDSCERKESLLLQDIRNKLNEKI